MTSARHSRGFAIAAVPAFPAAGLLVRAQSPPTRSGQSPGSSAQSEKDPNLVRVDVYPTSSGVPLTDLRANDFEIREDDVPQKIEFFEHVTIGSPAAPAGRPRIFVV